MPFIINCFFLSRFRGVTDKLASHPQICIPPPHGHNSQDCRWHAQEWSSFCPNHISTITHGINEILYRVYVTNIGTKCICWHVRNKKIENTMFGIHRLQDFIIFKILLYFGMRCAIDQELFSFIIQVDFRIR